MGSTFAFIVGYIAYKIGPRITLIIFAFIGMIGVIMTISTNLGAIIIGRICVGIL